MSLWNDKAEISQSIWGVSEKLMFLASLDLSIPSKIMKQSFVAIRVFLCDGYKRSCAQTRTISTCLYIVQRQVSEHRECLIYLVYNLLAWRGFFCCSFVFMRQDFTIAGEAGCPGTSCVAQAGLEPTFFLLQPPMFWNF